MWTRPRARLILPGVLGVWIAFSLLVPGPVTAKEESTAAPDVGLEALLIPEGLQQAHDLALRLIKEFDPLVPAETKALAEEYFANPGRGSTRAKAWSDVGAGAQLLNDPVTAAWAHLNAANLEWSGEYVANAGAGLVHAGRLNEASALLNAAHEMGFRSPYLFEALAAAHQRLGNAGEAKRHIQEAASRAPEDTFIRYENSLLNTGQPPAPAPPAADEEVQRAIQELEAHFKRILNELERQVNALNAAETQAGFQRDTSRDEWLESTRLRFAQELETIRSTTQASGDTDLDHNMTLYRCVHQYLWMTYRLLDSPSALHSDWVFWGECLNRSPATFAQDLGKLYRRQWSGQEPNSTLHSLMAADTGALLGTRNFMLDFQQGYKATQETNMINASPSNKEQFCSDWRSLVEKWAANTENRYRRFNANFDMTARRLLAWADAETLDAYDYANRTLKGLRKLKNEVTINMQGAPSGTLHDLQMQAINSTYHLLAQAWVFQMPALVSQGYRVDRDSMADLIAAERESCRASCEQVVEEILLSQLTEEEWKPYMEELAARLRGDVTAELKFKPNCEASIGPWTFNVDYKLNWDLARKSSANTRVKLAGQGTELTGVAVQTGYNAGASADGLVVKGSVSLVGKVNPQTGEWDTLVQASGGVGAGLQWQRGGTAYGVACYPGSGSVKFHARAFTEHLWDYVKADVQRPR